MKIKDILYRQRNNTKVAIEYLNEKITYSQMNERVTQNKELLVGKSKMLNCNNIDFYKIQYLMLLAILR